MLGDTAVAGEQIDAVNELENGVVSDALLGA